MTLLDHKKLGKLIVASRNGDEKAFQEFYSHTAPVQYYQILQMVKNPTEAHDALQETYFLLYQNLNEIRNPSAVVAYLNKLSYYTCKNLARVTANREMRQVKLEDVGELSSPNNDPQEVVIKSDESNRIRETILGLPKEEKLVLTMRYLQKLTLRQTAEAMGISYAKVQRLQKAAKEHLRRVLEEKGLMAALPFAHIISGELEAMMPRLLENGEGKELADVWKLMKSSEDSGGLQMSEKNGSPSKEQASNGNGSSSRMGNQASTSPIPKPPAPGLTPMLIKGALIAVGIGAAGSVVMKQTVPAPVIEQVELPKQFAKKPAAVTVRIKSRQSISECRLSDGQRAFAGHNEGNGVYSFSVGGNGRYRLFVKNTGGKTAERMIDVTCFDEEYPTVTSFETRDGKFFVRLSDVGSGIDYNSIYYTTPAGEKVLPTAADPATGNVVFFAGAGANVLHFADVSGNECETDMEY